MKFKDILTVVTSAQGDEHVIAAAEQIASRNDGRVSGVVIGWLPPVSLAVEGWSVSPVWGDIAEQARKELASEFDRVKARFARIERSGLLESELLELTAGRIVVGVRGRHADMTVVSRPRAEVGQALVEGALFESGRPVLVVPPQWKSGAIGKSIVVCWKPTRESARALGDADDFLLAADKVSVVTVDARPSEDGYGVHPGGDIAAHLARRGVHVEVCNLPSMGRSEVRVIEDQVRAQDADLIVMGGYGHSRMSEFIFGGMTRDMLKMAPVPVLMAH